MKDIKELAIKYLQEDKIEEAYYQVCKLMKIGEQIYVKSYLETYMEEINDYEEYENSLLILKADRIAYSVEIDSEECHEVVGIDLYKDGKWIGTVHNDGLKDLYYDCDFYRESLRSGIELPK
jgi:hypothetical protein